MSSPVQPITVPHATPRALLKRDSPAPPPNTRPAGARPQSLTVTASSLSHDLGAGPCLRYIAGGVAATSTSIVVTPRKAKNPAISVRLQPPDDGAATPRSTIRKRCT